MQKISKNDSILNSLNNLSGIDKIENHNNLKDFLNFFFNL